MGLNDVVITVTEKRVGGKVVQESREEIRQLSDTVKQSNRTITDFTKNGKVVSQTAKTMTGNFRRFRMEMLSVMFFGAAVASAFKGLLNPSFELMGVFDIFNTALAVGFLPTAQMVLGWALSFLKAFLDLPEPVRQFMGVIALLGIALGTFGLLWGAMTLGVEGLTAAWAGLSLVMSPWLLVVLAVIAAVAGLIYLWNNWGKISTQTKVVIAALAIALGLLLLPFSPILAGIALLFAAGIGIIAVIKNWGKITEWMSDKWQKFKTLVMDSPIGTAIRAIGSAFEWVKEKAVGVWNWIKKIVDLIANSPFGQTISKIVSKAVELGGNILGTRQFGGTIPTDGLYRLHAGETVVPSNQNLNFSPVFNITNSGSPLDIARLKMEISQQFARELGGLARR